VAIPFYVDETELTVTRAQGGDQGRHVSISLQTTETLHGFEDAGGDPTKHHLSSAPAFDVSLHHACAANETLDGVSRRQRTTQARRQVQREDGERFLEAFADAFGGAGILGLESAREIEQEPLGGLQLGGLIGPPQDRLRPRAIAIDQNPIRRRGTGLRALDQARPSPGLTLFAPLGGTAVHLIDLHGTVVHAWNLPYRPGVYGYITERVTLFYNGQIPNDTFIGKQPFMGGAAMEVDWTGKILWEVRKPDHHHDGRLLRNGNIILLCTRELPDAIAKRVRGGRPGTEVDGKRIWADFLIEATTTGKVVWEWRSWDHLESLS
jgi:hypothetical protein